MAGEFAPFEIEAGDVTMFAATEVVYLQVTRGAEELRKMHDAFARGLLAFGEPYPYHPHITLGQELGPGGAEAAFEVAVRRWREHSSALPTLCEPKRRLGLRLRRSDSACCWCCRSGCASCPRSSSPASRR